MLVASNLYQPCAKTFNCLIYNNKRFAADGLNVKYFYTCVKNLYMKILFLAEMTNFIASNPPESIRRRGVRHGGGSPCARIFRISYK